MQVKFGERFYEYPSQQLGELRESNDILHDTPALLQRLAEDGYLLIRQLIPYETVEKSRQTILQHMADHEGTEPGSRRLDGVMGQYGKSVSMRKISRHPDVLATLEAPQVVELYERLFGEPVITFTYKWLRAIGREKFTGSHIDKVYMNQGTDRLLTCWIPLGNLDIQQGVLAICEGSNRLPGFEKVHRTYGRMDVDRDRVDGWFTNDPQEITDKFGGQWKTTSFRMGDILTFGMYTMHASTTNTTDRWRLSCDVRYQPASEPADRRWVGENPIAHYAWQKEPEKLIPMAKAREQWGI